MILMIEQCDVLIVGAATSGTYLGWLLAQKGHSVLVIEKDPREKVAERLEIIHFHQKTMHDLNIPPPSAPPELIIARKDIYVARLPLFLQRMYPIIEKSGAHVEFSCSFKSLIYENNRIIGAQVEKAGKLYSVKARLVVDASGCASVVRISLPPTYGIETWQYDSTNRYFVILYYIKWLKPDEPHPDWDYVRPYYMLFIDPGYSHAEPIMGLAGPESYANTQKLFEETMAKEPMPPFEITKKEYGSFVVSRQLHSLVADGILCIGDAAAIMNTIGARGIAETWQFCYNAVPILHELLQKPDYLTREALWKITADYTRTIGAEMMFSYTISAAMTYLSEAELNFVIVDLRAIIDPGVTKPDLPPGTLPPENPHADNEISLSFGRIMRALGKILWAILRGKIALSHFHKFIKMVLLGLKIKKHYKRFPTDPTQFSKWEIKANALWKLRKTEPRQFQTLIGHYP